MTLAADQPIDPTWAGVWRGQWIWDNAIETPVTIWGHATPGESHTVYLRRPFRLDAVPRTVPARVTCDSRYALYVNGTLVGRGPVRGEPELLGWDDHDLAPYLRAGNNVIVALCRYYGKAGPWFIPAVPFGTLGRGSFCFETAASSALDLRTDATWRAVPAPWRPMGWALMHGVPPEVVDGRDIPNGLHDPDVADDAWPAAVVLHGIGHGTVLDRPPAAPYMSPQRRAIPQLTANWRTPKRGAPAQATVALGDDPVAAWATLAVRTDGDRVVTRWDIGELTIGHVRLRIQGGGADRSGQIVDVIAGETLRPDGLPEIAPTHWASRYVLGAAERQEIQFFDPVGHAYLAVHAPAGLDVSVDVEEAFYPRTDEATFTCSDPRYDRLWKVGARTVDVCATDAFLDCPAREQRAWVSDSYVGVLVHLVTTADQRLVRHHLDYCRHGRYPGGLLAMAFGCDAARSGLAIAEYSLHWIRQVARYWEHSGDEAFVRDVLPVANDIIERYERQRGPSGLLEDFPGWVFIEWAQTERDTVIAAHDGYYAAALRDYATLPGAADVRPLIARTAAAFEALWDERRHAYVDSMGSRGKSRRVSQQTNIAALLGGIVPRERIASLIERTFDPTVRGERLVLASRPAGPPTTASVFQYDPHPAFDDARDVVMAQPFYTRFLHEVLFEHDRRDLILRSLLDRWDPETEHGTFREHWDAAPGRTSRAHAWAASPTYDLTAYILGVRPAEPGYRRTIVDPYLGPLTHAAGRVPTPLGWIDVRIDEREIEITAPEGMPVRVGDSDVRGHAVVARPAHRG
ncbi:MAG: hypothetical protein M3O64_03625 [Chloroflexota bacterium]|nr:hypothetical protein [Chloroflexota bacterium]